MKFSKFADKFSGDSGILQLMNDLGHAVNQDREIHMLGGGNPASIPNMESCYRSEMLKMLEDGNQFERMVGNYDSPQGNQRFIDALAEFLRDTYGWPLSSRNIAITNGSQAGFGILFNLFSGQFSDGIRKKVLLPMTPEYIGYSDVGLDEREIFKANRPVIQMDQDNSLFYKYRVDFSGLMISEEIGGICISRPTNPTGNVITDNELSKLSEMARNSGIPLILDGAYGEPFPGITITPAKPIWDDHIILCLSLSKLGLPGARTGIVVAHPDVIDIMTSTNAIFNLAPGRFGPSLLTRLVENRELISLCETEITPYYKRRVDQTVKLVSEYMKGLPVKMHKPEGSMFLWLWFDELPITSEVLYKQLKLCGVYIIPGSHFFPGLDDDKWAHKQQPGFLPTRGTRSL